MAHSVLLLLSAFTSGILAAVALVLLPSAHAYSLDSFPAWDDPRYADPRHSMGYESPPPEEIAPYVVYKPPHPRLLKENEEWAREVRGSVTRRQILEYTQSMKKAQAAELQRRKLSSSGSSSSRSGGGGSAAEQLRGGGSRHQLVELLSGSPPPPPQADDPDRLAAEAALGFYPSSPTDAEFAADDGGDAIDDGVTAESALDAEYALPDEDGTPQVVLDAIATNASQTTAASGIFKFRFHRIWGVPLKDKMGRWYTYVSKYNWWWGADDPFSKFWTCRFKAPGLYGFNCTLDRTCPGCDRCRGYHCYGTQNTWAYRSTNNLFKNTLTCAIQPTLCGTSCKIATPEDIGIPGMERCFKRDITPNFGTCPPGYPGCIPTNQ